MKGSPGGTVIAGAICLASSIALATPLPNPPFMTGGFVPPDSDVYKQEVAVGKLLTKYALSKTKCDQKAVIALQLAYEPPGAPKVPDVQADWTECQGKVLLKYQVARDKLLLKGTPACLDQAGIDAIKGQLDTQIGLLGVVVYCDADAAAPDPVTGLNIPDFKNEASGEVAVAKVLTKTGRYGGKCYSLALKYAFKLGGVLPSDILDKVNACFEKAAELGHTAVDKLEQTQQLPDCLPAANAHALVDATVTLSGDFNDETYCAE